ncbi:MAG: WD40/YVTN/BNR-like repeat-containing protein [Vicinamibacterales bacterium]
MSLSRVSRAALLAAVGLVCALAVWPASLDARQTPNLFANLTFREIGPTAQGGRFVDYAVVEATPRIFYAATASGGLWKTESHGVSFTSVFDNEKVISIGAVAVSQSNPQIVYVGTGEANNSRSSYWGNGVYRSDNGGESWTHLGLDETHHIGRVVVDPKDPNIVYVAALGKLYSHNPERGLYKTTDGGKTWTKSLDYKVDGREIGVVDVVMDPRNPQVLYAATYDKVRKPWTFGEGGLGGAVHKTTDAGRTWTRLTNGLPTGLIGRIGLAIARQDSNRVYAVIENANARSGDPNERIKRMAEGFGGDTIGDEFYRSDDAGKTWTKVAPAPAPAGAAGGRGGGGFGANPPYYYGQIRVDPNNKDHIYLLSVGVTHSLDGGRTWTSAFNFGGDNHAMWINPADSNHMILGHDHGMGVTFDGGRSWIDPQNLPLAQFYAVGYDMDYPYNVYGGLQDNSCLWGPSTMKNGGPIPFEAWGGIGSCGDGFYVVPDPTDSRWVYSEGQFGVIGRTDKVTGQTRNIQYRRPQGEEPVRYNWNAPIVVSPHNPQVIYHAGQMVLRSNDRGDTWTEISPDLSVNDPARRNGSGNIQYGTITSLDESTIMPGLLWVGTDDGNVQVTRDNGRTWTNVRENVPGHPGYWVSRVAPSFHDPAVAYLSITGYRHDDFRPFVWKTSDYGKTWTSLAANLPTEAGINVILEDRKNPNFLVVGTELALFFSLDGGQSWTRVRGNMPTTPIYDLKIHPRENELIVATHGRGIWIADITPFQHLTAPVQAQPAALVPIQPAVQWNTGLTPFRANDNFRGESRAPGVHISYYLQRDVTGDVTIQVFDGARVIADVQGPRTAGVHKVLWTMQGRREAGPGEAAGRGGRGGRGGFGGGRGGGAPAVTSFPTAAPGSVLSTVSPGTYRVVLTVNGQSYEQTATILADHWTGR